MWSHLAIIIGLLVITRVYSRTTGELTFYSAGGDSGGTCMLYNPRTAISNSMPTIAIGDFNNGEKCGRCVKIYPSGTGRGNSNFPNRQPFIAYVNNKCPECGPNNLDLAENGDGRWDITWEFVTCPINTNIDLQLKVGSSVYWTELQVRDYVVGLANVEFLINGAWVSLQRQPYNYWRYTTKINSTPITVRLTPISGNAVTTSIPNYNIIEPGLIKTNVQFVSSNPTPIPPSPIPPSPIPPSPIPPSPIPPSPIPPSNPSFNYIGNVAWSSNCDFYGSDLKDVRVPSEQCGNQCISTPTCTHFSWTTFNSGTCWMKNGWYNPNDAITTTGGVCGFIINWARDGNIDWAPYCDFNGNDLNSVNSKAEECGGKCSSTAGCTHFTWSSYNGGTCFMKRNGATKSNAFLITQASFQTVCGINIAPTRETSEQIIENHNEQISTPLLTVIVPTVVVGGISLIVILVIIVMVIKKKQEAVIDSEEEMNYTNMVGEFINNNKYRTYYE